MKTGISQTMKILNYVSAMTVKGQRPTIGAKVVGIKYEETSVRYMTEMKNGNIITCKRANEKEEDIKKTD